MGGVVLSHRTLVEPKGECVHLQKAERAAGAGGNVLHMASRPQSIFAWVSEAKLRSSGVLSGMLCGSGIMKDIVNRSFLMQTVWDGVDISMWLEFVNCVCRRSEFE